MQAGGTPPVPDEYDPRGDIKKIAGILVALALFVIVIVLYGYIIPLQGGLISSTAIRSSDLSGAEPQFQEQMPIQEVDLGASGRSIFIAFVMLTHILFANLHLEGAWVLLSLVILYLLSRKERYSRLGKSVALFNVILFSAGATLAATGVLFFIALYPTFATQGFHIYWWPLLVEAILFGVEIFFVYTLWFTWDRIRPGVHLALGFGYAVSVFVQTVTIDTLAAGMLTPGAKTIHYIDQKDFAAKKQWDWVAAYGIAWGLAGLIMQPILGQLYMTAIQENAPSAFTMIMHGPRAWEMLMMVTLLAGLFLTIGTYFLTRRDQLLSRPENRTIRTIFKGFLVMTAVAGFILVQPAWLGTLFIDDPGAWINPIGGMPLKYVALFVMAAIGAAIVMLDVIVLTSEEKEGQWGYLTRGSLLAAFTAGILGTAIVNVMGFERESARAPWTFYQIIPVPGGQAYATPLPLPVIAGVWVIVLALTWAIFWYVAKVTAYHPTDEDSV